MQDITQAEAIHWLATQQKITFLTGAGISTASGVPDYRSLKGVYQGIQQPEYLLSRTCLKQSQKSFINSLKRSIIQTHNLISFTRKWPN